MRIKLITIAAIMLTAVAHSGESMRCGRWIVDESATPEELLKKCGEPTSMRYEESDARARGPAGTMIKVGTVITEYWTYDRSRQASPIVVIVVDGKIRKMERVPR